jgi:hypothetical protein
MSPLSLLVFLSGAFIMVLLGIVAVTLRFVSKEDDWF